MKHRIANMLKKLGVSVSRYDEKQKRKSETEKTGRELYEKYKSFTMIPSSVYSDNLHIAGLVQHINGDVVECGVWRGGMIAGIAEILGQQRKYWLFDSFEGLPPAREEDGALAKKWQSNKESEYYYDNCSAEQSYAETALANAGVSRKEIIKGWFDQTLSKARITEIALLRLDGDWYESTKTCLHHLYPLVAKNGIIIIDDYYFWDGCAKAVHDYLSENRLSDRICQSEHGVAYIIKDKNYNTLVGD